MFFCARRYGLLRVSDRVAEDRREGGGKSHALSQLRAVDGTSRHPGEPHGGSGNGCVFHHGAGVEVDEVGLRHLGAGRVFCDEDQGRGRIVHKLVLPEGRGRPQIRPGDEFKRMLFPVVAPDAVLREKEDRDAPEVEAGRSGSLPVLRRCTGCGPEEVRELGVGT